MYFNMLPIELLDVIIEMTNYQVDLLMASKSLISCVKYLNKQNIIYVKHTIHCLNQCTWLLHDLMIYELCNTYKIYNQDDYSNENNILLINQKRSQEQDIIFYEMENFPNLLCKRYFINNYRVQSIFFKPRWFNILLLSYFQTNVVSKNYHKNKIYKDNAVWCIKKIMQILFKSLNTLTITGKKKYGFTVNRNTGQNYAIDTVELILTVIDRYLYNMGISKRIKLNHIDNSNKFCEHCELWYSYECQLCKYSDCDDEIYNCMEELFRSESTIITAYIEFYNI